MSRNPYWGLDLFEFFPLFFKRTYQLFTSMDFTSIASDEVQVYVLSLIAINSAMVGCFLLLRKMTMLANSLSHTILFGLVVAYLFTASKGFAAAGTFDLPTLLIAALISSLLTNFLTQLLHRGLKVQEDASIGLVFTGLFALGIICVTLFTRNAHFGLEVIMGSADALLPSDLYPVFWLTLSNLFLFTLLYYPFLLTTFDAQYARTLGFRSSLYHYLLMFQVALTVISAFRAVGVLLVLSLIVTPALIAKLFCRSLKTMLFCSCFVGVFCAVLGVALSRHALSVWGISVSTSALSVVLVAILYMLLGFYQLSWKGKKRWKKSDSPFSEAPDQSEKTPSIS